MQHTHPKALEYVDGIGVHFYTDEIIPANVFAPVSRQYPDKFIISTEACEGIYLTTYRVYHGFVN